MQTLVLFIIFRVFFIQPSKATVRIGSQGNGSKPDLLNCVFLAKGAFSCWAFTKYLAHETHFAYIQIVIVFGLNGIHEAFRSILSIYLTIYLS